MRAPRATRSASSGLAIANVLGTGVELHGDGLDPPHGLVAGKAARIVCGGGLVVVEKRRLAAAVAAGCADHADKAPMNHARCHRSVKYGLGLGVQVGFKLGTGDKVKEEGETVEGGPSGDQYLKAGTPSPDYMKART